MDYVSCNICGLNAARSLYEIAGYSIVRCNKCGLVYVNPQPTFEELKEFYNKEFFSKKWYEKFPQLRNFSYFQKTLADIEGFKSYIYGIKKYETSGKLLDVGCGDGWLLKHARDYGFEVYGVEPTLKAFEEAKKKIGENIFNSTLEEVSFKDNFFDIVISIGTIEHLKDPFSLLKEIHRILRQNGLLVIQTPNIDSYLARKQGSKWEQFIVPGHLYFFSPKTMRLLLEKAGYAVLEFDMKIPLFSPMDYGTLIKGANLNKGYKGTNGTSNKIKNAFLKILMPLKPFLIPIYDSLCHLRGSIIGRHDIVVYARKLN
jgi:2-polyprenyl-3-methyl-5-hydroxy-6-metoxy-1,4-benzoquinol methylase